MTDLELVNALRKQSEATNDAYRAQLEKVAIARPGFLQTELSILRERAEHCQAIAQLLHQQEFHAKQKAEMAATAS